MSQVQPDINFQIKTQIEHPEEINNGNIIYVRALLREIKKDVEETLQKIKGAITENLDKDICELPQQMPIIVRSGDIPLTANCNVVAKIYYGHFNDLERDLVIDRKFIELVKINSYGDETAIEKGDLYVAIKGWNKICREGWIVRKLLEEDNYNVTILIIYKPRNEDEYDDP